MLTLNFWFLKMNKTSYKGFCSYAFTVFVLLFAYIGYILVYS